MTPRIICPHCRHPIDPLTLEDAVSAGTRYLICPECDDLIALSADATVSVVPSSDSEEEDCGEISAPLLETLSSTLCLAESHAQ